MAERRRPRPAIGARRRPRRHEHLPRGPPGMIRRGRIASVARPPSGRRPTEPRPLVWRGRPRRKSRLQKAVAPALSGDPRPRSRTASPHVSVEPPSPTPAVWRSELNTTERAEHPVEGCADGVGSAVATGRSRLTLGELANVWVDEPGAPFQIALVAEFDATPFQRGDGSVDLRRIRAELVSRAGRVPALRRRLVWRRFGLGRPYWVDDAVFQPEEHVSCASLPVGASFTD